ncbi:major facilitator superfamily domain-containing protein [Neohortaea acidophila]|uniref:Major facilitator superfamily domain-containing protein n=1 Tax=Neohortaea acidophila TaxID=245834 RepID=A0A6A6PJH5_9PEZI|nr:major facilitator superfamily domain-containing protein [Neohortaea acidophila]KAF2479861.1 major facilitator superfamily domain-containing protein [Neohortaea acidophila]
MGSSSGSSVVDETEISPLLQPGTSSPTPDEKPSSQLSILSGVTRLWRRDSKTDTNLEDIATQPSVFDNPKLAHHFRPSAQYENLHRFDPSARWTWAEELPLIRKLDYKVTLWACLAFFALDLPRSNVSSANTDNFLDDLGLTTNDFNLGNSLFRVGFLLAELPSQLLSKRLGPDVWIPAQMIMWSFVSASQFWLRGRRSYLFCRVLIGTLQGGFIPDLILYLSYFFKSSELPFRLALFWLSNRITNVISPLFAFGLLHLEGVAGREGWRWLFMIEGAITFAIGCWSFFCMVPSITETKARWRPPGWFTEREEVIAVNRVLRDDPSKGDMHNREGISLRLLWRTLRDFDLWPLYLIGLTFGIPVQPPEAYLTLTLRRLQFGVYASNLLCIPIFLLTSVTMLIFTPLAERFNQRAIFGALAQIWLLACVLGLRFLPADAGRWTTYIVTGLLISYPYPHPVQVAWCSRISNAVSTRAVSAALYNMAVQLQYIIAANVYREDDRPLYRRGNSVLACIGGMNIVIYLLVKVYYTKRNQQKRKQWNALSPEEQEVYRQNTTDAGSRRLDFQFVS